MGSQVALVANNYGRGVFGLYDATKYQHVWGMGAAYKLADGGTSTGTGGNMYGLAWSYTPNYSVTGTNQQARAGLGHQLLLMSNGTTYTALGTGIWTSGTITSTAQGTLWGSSNDGSNSGLDADLLDAQHGSYYLAYGNFSGTPTIPSGNQIIDWTLSGAGTINPTNYLNTNTTNLNLKITGASAVNMSAGNTLEFAGTGIASVTRSATKITVAVGAYSATAPLSIVASTKVISIAQSSTSANGYLSSTDWNSFNSRISNSATQASNLYIRSTAPTIYLRDTDHISSMIHQNSNVFYVLRADAADDVTWTTFADATSANGRWPLVMDLRNTNHSASFGTPNLYAGGYTVYHSGNIPTNSASVAGIVPAGVANKVWKTGSDGTPAWRDDAEGSSATGTVTSVTATANTGLTITNTTTTPVITLDSTLTTLGSASFTTLNVEILDADKILTRDIRVGPTGQTNSVDNAAKIGTNPAGTEPNTTLTGTGAHLNKFGDFFVGNSAGSHMFFDQSEGTLAMKSGTTGARTEIVGGTTTVYDANDNARVKIGDLS